ncbi:flagellar motor protein MotB [Patulibacter defluvii]|uniref:flagellar motor protein MotB n=1 Tax=Patulibacter defluvii TaxID=3095358 RepID=UPI002A751799|nr:flagellar motor protein MotB [Patulibacter sp. DM4]
MSRRRARARAGGGHGGGGSERWLLTYADMITLLMALFIVMFAVSVVDQRKFDEVSRSLREAFSGKLLTGAGSIRPEPSAAGEAERAPVEAVAAIAPLAPEVVPAERLPPARRAAAAARREEQELRALKRRIDAWIARRGLGARVRTAVDRRGLVIRVLTDDVLFRSGDAALRPAGRALLADVGRLLQLDRRHPIAVDGHTDSVPIGTDRYPSNWELSGARASSVVRVLAAGAALDPARFSATGYGAERPRSSNATTVGRRANRRVEIALLRLERPTSRIP